MIEYELDEDKGEVWVLMDNTKIRKATIEELLFQLKEKLK